MQRKKNKKQKKAWTMVARRQRANHTLYKQKIALGHFIQCNPQHGSINLA
jgi:hypothetical protein